MSANQVEVAAGKAARSPEEIRRTKENCSFRVDDPKKRRRKEGKTGSTIVIRSRLSHAAKSVNPPCCKSYVQSVAPLKSAGKISFQEAAKAYVVRWVTRSPGPISFTTYMVRGVVQHGPVALGNTLGLAGRARSVIDARQCIRRNYVLEVF